MIIRGVTLVDNMKLKKFPWLEGSQSQIGQESWVAFALNYKRHGFYLEIGAFNARVLSNTFVLETSLEWTGTGVEINQQLTETYNSERRNQIICADATALDYGKELDRIKAPSTIDYLQVDIDPPSNSYKALVAVLRGSRRFSLITFEHDLYRRRFKFLPVNYYWKWKAFLLLRLKGYVRVASNVANGKARQEDWYASKSMNLERIRLPRSVDFRAVFQNYPK